MQLKNAPHLWSEFSVCTSAHTDDDMEIAPGASYGVDEQEPATENTFFDESGSNFNVVDGMWSFSCVSTHSAQKQQDSKLSKNIRERHIWCLGDFSDIENGCIKGPDLVSDVRDFQCTCGASWTYTNHVLGQTQLDRTLTVFTKRAPVQCRVLTRICTNNEGPCELKWDEGGSRCIHIVTRDTAAGDEISWAFVNLVLCSKITFSAFCKLKTQEYKEYNINLRSFMDPSVFIKWWFSWASFMKLEFRQTCPVCKFNPKQLACDGTKVGVGFRNIKFQEISQPDDEVNIKPTIHRRMTRCFLAQRPDVETALIKEAREHLHYISRLNEIPTPERLPVMELSNRNALLLSLLDESVKPVFVRFLDNMSLDERLVFANEVKMLASTAPVNSIIPYVYATSLADLTDHLAGDKLNEDGDVFFTRKMLEMREYAPEIRDLIATSMTSNISENGENYLPRDIILFIRYLIVCF